MCLNSTGALPAPWLLHFPLRASRAPGNRIGFDCLLYKSLALPGSPKVRCRVLLSSPCPRAWLRRGAVLGPDRQMCGNKGDRQCDRLDGKFLFKALRCDFRSLQCWGDSYASSSSLQSVSAVSSVLSQLPPMEFVPSVLCWIRPQPLTDWDQQVPLQLCLCAVLHKIPALTVLCCVTRVP